MPTITFTEKELEDHFCKVAMGELRLRVVQRQARIDCGVIDVLARNIFTRADYVVELKIGPIDSDAIAQGYSYALELQKKYPHRTFSVLLIGSEVKGRHVKNCIQEYAPLKRGGLNYKIFGWTMEDGVSFDWFDRVSKASEERIKKAGEVARTITSSFRVMFRDALQRGELDFKTFTNSLLLY